MPHRKLPWWYFWKPFPDASGTFTYAQWARHQSIWRFALQPTSLMIVVFNMVPLLIWVTLISVFCASYYELYQTQGPGRLVLVSEKYIEPFLLSSLFLALLLVHRISSSSISGNLSCLMIFSFQGRTPCYSFVPLYSLSLGFVP